MEVYVVHKGMDYEGSTVEGIYLTVDDALKHAETNPPDGFGDDYLLITAHTVGQKAKGRLVQSYRAFESKSRWEKDDLP